MIGDFMTEFSEVFLLGAYSYQIHLKIVQLFKCNLNLHEVTFAQLDGPLRCTIGQTIVGDGYSVSSSVLCKFNFKKKVKKELNSEPKI